MQDTVSSNNDVLQSTNNATKNEQDFKQITNYETDYQVKTQFPSTTRGVHSQNITQSNGSFRMPQSTRNQFSNSKTKTSYNRGEDILQKVKIKKASSKQPKQQLKALDTYMQGINTNSSQFLATEKRQESNLKKQTNQEKGGYKYSKKQTSPKRMKK